MNLACHNRCIPHVIVIARAQGFAYELPQTADRTRRMVLKRGPASGLQDASASLCRAALDEDWNYWTMSSACRAPADLMAWRMAIIPEGVSPILFKPLTSVCKFVPFTIEIGPPCGVASRSVLGVTIVRPFEKGSGWEATGDSLI